MISKDTKVLITKKTLGCSLRSVISRKKFLLTFEDITHRGEHVRAVVGYFQKFIDRSTFVIDYEPGTGTGDFYNETDFTISHFPDELFEI